MHQWRTYECQDTNRMKQVAPALFVDCRDLLGTPVNGISHLLFVQEALAVQWGLREKPVCGGDSEDPAESGGQSEKEDIPGIATRLADIVAGERRADCRDFDVEEEECGYDEAGDHGGEDPGDRKVPEFNKEAGSLGRGWAEGCLGVVSAGASHEGGLITYWRPAAVAGQEC